MKGCTGNSETRRRITRFLAGAAATGVAVATVGAGAHAATVAADSRGRSPQWMVQILFDNSSGQPWSKSTFQRLSRDGLTGVEINMNWAAVEPSPGHFDWSVLQQYLQYCRQTHLKLIPIFWEYGYPGNPPAWLAGGNEVTSSGAPAAEPAFWSRRAYAAYATYVARTLTALRPSPGFGGAYIAYGWLDAGFGPSSSGMAGYAPQDVARFRTWLAQRYGSIGAFNRAAGVDYASFAAVPAFLPKHSHFSIYQQFRAWSYATLLGRVLAVARKATHAPLYIYYGGGMSDVGMLGNLPDSVFQLARKYHTAVTMDTATHTAFDALFGFLSQAYKVPVLNEWTPVPGSRGQLAQWLGQYPLEGSYGAGEDYFIYQGAGNQPPYFADTYPSYVALHRVLGQVRGALPSYTAGIMLGYTQVLYNDQGTGIPGGVSLLGNYLRAVRPAANVFSDFSVLDGAVSLKQFHIILDWNNVLQARQVNPRLAADVKAFKARGGVIIPGPALANETPFKLLLNHSPLTSVMQTLLARHASAPASKPELTGMVPYDPYLYDRLPPAVAVTPNAPQLETFLRVDKGTVWLVAANIGTTAFSGTVALPSTVLDQIMPGSGGEPGAAQSLLGSWQRSGTDAWRLSLGGGSIAVLAIHPKR